MGTPLNRFALDVRSSTPGEPFVITTSDCSNPFEIDDGSFVNALDADTEMYHVGVCVADTSKLYADKSILNQAMSRTEAKYYRLPNGAQAYEPMIDEEIVREIEFSAGNTRSAMIIQFVVGADQPPTDVEITFGRVEVLRNYNYRDFWLQTQAVEGFDKYARVSELILEHLAFNTWRDSDEPYDAEEPDKLPAEPSMEDLIRCEWRAGAQQNEILMVGAGVLAGALFDAEKRLAIYRLHDPNNPSNVLFLPPHLARYSWEPGPHEGLGVPQFCRVTSPMRRLEDFIMCGLAGKRHKGTSLTPHDADIAIEAVQRLNHRVASDYMHKPVLQGRSSQNKHSRQIARSLIGLGNVLHLRRDDQEEAIA